MRLLVGGWILCALACAQETPTATFGTTVTSSSGLQGQIYLLTDYADALPRFNPKRSVGTIYATSLNIPRQSFMAGFPGITNRFEWFAIDYTGKFWVETPGQYAFRLASDDGSKLWIDDRLVIDNDGLHDVIELTATATLSRGVHHLRLAYFQGPRVYLALVFSVKRPGEAWRIFDTDHFRPPADIDVLPTGTISQIKRAENW